MNEAEQKKAAIKQAKKALSKIKSYLGEINSFLDNGTEDEQKNAYIVCLSLSEFMQSKEGMFEWAKKAQERLKRNAEANNNEIMH